MAVTVTDVIKKYSLRSLTPEIPTDNIRINHSDINRPALQLAGYFDHFGKERVQIIGLVEYTYIETMERERKLQVFDTLFSGKIPCLVYCRSLEPDDIAFSERAKQFDLLLVPGSGFGAPGHFRLAYCVQPEMIVRSLPKFKELADSYR